MSHSLEQLYVSFCAPSPHLEEKEYQAGGVQETSYKGANSKARNPAERAVEATPLLVQWLNLHELSFHSTSYRPLPRAKFTNRPPPSGTWTALSEAHCREPWPQLPLTSGAASLPLRSFYCSRGPT